MKRLNNLIIWRFSASKCFYFILTSDILVLLLRSLKLYTPIGHLITSQKMNFIVFLSFFHKKLFKRNIDRRYFDFLFLNFPPPTLLLIRFYFFLTNFSLIVIHCLFWYKKMSSKNFGNFPVKHPCGVLFNYTCRPPWTFSKKLFRTAIWEESI